MRNSLAAVLLLFGVSARATNPTPDALTPAERQFIADAKIVQEDYGYIPPDLRRRTGDVPAQVADILAGARCAHDPADACYGSDAEKIAAGEAALAALRVRLNSILTAHEQTLTGAQKYDGLLAPLQQKVLNSALSRKERDGFSRELQYLSEQLRDGIKVDAEYVYQSVLERVNAGLAAADAGKALSDKALKVLQSLTDAELGPAARTNFGASLSKLLTTAGCAGSAADAACGRAPLTALQAGSAQADELAAAVAAESRRAKAARLAIEKAEKDLQVIANGAVSRAAQAVDASKIRAIMGAAGCALAEETFDCASSPLAALQQAGPALDAAMEPILAEIAGPSPQDMSEFVLRADTLSAKLAAAKMADENLSARIALFKLNVVKSPRIQAQEDIRALAADVDSAIAARYEALSAKTDKLLTKIAISPAPLDSDARTALAAQARKILADAQASPAFAPQAAAELDKLDGVVDKR
jgi:hypothetical protein